MAQPGRYACAILLEDEGRWSILIRLAEEEVGAQLSIGLYSSEYEARRRAEVILQEAERSLDRLALYAVVRPPAPEGTEIPF